MNNQQFRNLLIGNSKSKDGAASPSSSRPAAASSLGSRKQSSIPMTPRSVGLNTTQADFARQLAERNAIANPTKKTKSSMPKGVKLAAGFTDRTKARADDEKDERVQRIKALEESMKLGQIDRQTFDNLVQEMVGGDIESTHLVRGLDFKLLERIKAGEDVFNRNKDSIEEGKVDPGVEDEFDEIAEHDVAPMAREKTEKKGQIASPPPVAGVKRSRDSVLAELKAQRKAAAEAAAAEHKKKFPSLGSNFRKVGQADTRIEVDSQGRDVLIITDEHGKEKRKVRKQKVEQPEPEVDPDSEADERELDSAKVPAPQDVDEDSDDDDIFAGVGSNYNPLAALQDDEEGSSDEDEDEAKAVGTETSSGDKRKATFTAEEGSDGTPSTKPTARNYFNDRPSESKSVDTADATVRAALAKVRSMNPDSDLLQDSEEARLRKRAAELAAKDRDMEDLDMGFGSSRFDDADEMEREGEKVKFSEWKGIGVEDDDEEGQGAGSGKKRKRGPKKKKGDKNNADDVLKVMERQKGARSLG